MAKDACVLFRNHFSLGFLFKSNWVSSVRHTRVFWVPFTCQNFLMVVGAIFHIMLAVFSHKRNHVHRLIERPLFRWIQFLQRCRSAARLRPFKVRVILRLCLPFRGRSDWFVVRSPLRVSYASPKIENYYFECGKVTILYCIYISKEFGRWFRPAFDIIRNVG